MNTLDNRRFVWSLERGGERIDEGTIEAKDADAAVRKLVEQHKDSPREGDELHFAKPTGETQGERASATYGDLSFRVELERKDSAARARREGET